MNEREATRSYKPEKDRVVRCEQKNSCSSRPLRSFTSKESSKNVNALLRHSGKYNFEIGKIAQSKVYSAHQV